MGKIDAMYRNFANYLNDLPFLMKSGLTTVLVSAAVNFSSMTLDAYIRNHSQIENRQEYSHQDTSIRPAGPIEELVDPIVGSVKDFYANGGGKTVETVTIWTAVGGGLTLMNLGVYLGRTPKRRKSKQDRV